MAPEADAKRVGTLVIGGGQAGLVMGYHLAQRGIPYTIVDAGARVGDAWRRRWDSLRLFTPNRLNSLPGFAIRGDRWGFPSKDEFADYLEAYARHHGLAIQTGVRVDRLTRVDDRYVGTAGDRTFHADNVVVAMSSWQKPRVPEFAGDLDPSIVQLHVADYKNPSQLADGPVLVVGAGNSGAEVAKELAADHDVWLAGPSTGAVPFRPENLSGRLMMPFVGRVIFHRVLTTSTPIGRKARPKMVATGEPLIRVKPKDLKRLGVQRVGRVTGVEGGRPVLDHGTVINAANVVWCTGFRPDFSWIDLPVTGPQGPVHDRGIVESERGLYFLGLKFLYAVSSEQVHGVGRDAGHIADTILARRDEDPAASAVPQHANRRSA